MGPVQSAALSHGLERRISSRILWFAVVVPLGAGAGRTGGRLVLNRGTTEVASAPPPLFSLVPLPHRRKSFCGVAWIRMLSLVLCFAGAPVFALTGTVERVADGDTLRLVSPSGERTTIRLAGIDAPEKSQPFGHAAGRRLAALCLGKNAEAAFRATDRYGRTVARVFCDRTDAGRTLIEEGLAWHYVQYTKTQPSDEALGDASAEAAARGEKRGLWADLEPQAPWDYRKARKAGSKRRPLTD